jgi:hypothetical protein
MDLALDGAMLDRSGGEDANTGRVGYFSDIYFDPQRGQWWGLSDRGPGGGALHYETRVQRFRLKIDKKTGEISGFKILKTVIFKDESGNPMDGIAPNPSSILDNAFDPEGFVIGLQNRNFYVPDEYGPSLYEFNHKGVRVRAFVTPANLIPRNATNVTNYAGDTGNTAGKRTNRGFEGLAISPDGDYVYAMLQSAMLDEGLPAKRMTTTRTRTPATEALLISQSNPWADAAASVCIGSPYVETRPDRYCHAVTFGVSYGFN